MNPSPPSIPVRPTVKSTYKPMTRLHGDDLPKLRRLKKAEFSSSTASYGLFARRTLATKLNVWHRQHTHTLDTLRKEQLGVYHLMCRVQRERRRVQREEHEQLREDIRRLFHRQRKRQMLRRVIAKFRENVKKKRAEREAGEGQNEVTENHQGDDTSSLVQSSIARFKRTLDQSGNRSGNTLTGVPTSDSVSSPLATFTGQSDQTNIGDLDYGKDTAPATLSPSLKSVDQSCKRSESQVNGNPSLPPVLTIEPIKMQRVIPPIRSTSSTNGKSTNEERDPSNPLITQTHVIAHVARVNTPRGPVSERNDHRPFGSDNRKYPSRSTSSQAPHGHAWRSADDARGAYNADNLSGYALAGHEFTHSDSRAIPNTRGMKTSSVMSCAKTHSESGAAEETQCEAELEAGTDPEVHAGGGRAGRERNLVRKLKKERERRLRERAEILDSETIVRYSRKPYQDVTPMYGQPRRFQFEAPSQKLHHEQAKLIRAEQSVELERQVKINSFFDELFKPKDDDRFKFAKKDEETEKPKKNTLSLAGVLSGLFSIELTDAPKGKQTLQDKFRRLQSCQYLRVYHPRSGSELEDHRVTSWDAAERSLKTGFGAFDGNR